MLDPQQSVASLVLDHSECAPIFQRHRIDFCCRGELSIAAAAKERNIDPGALVRELDEVIRERSRTGDVDPRGLTTTALIGHIVARHHEYLRRALPFILGLARKVSRVHGDHNPRLRELEAALVELAGTLLPHLDEEERQLFPALIAQEVDCGAVVRGALEEMRMEHLAVGELLERIHDATEDFLLPPWACNSYRTLFAELEQLEVDVFQHVHLENHVLAPRFRAV